ncbi:MAG: hypothetical protein K2W95_04200 [Candidatus Obscuribacterales bacterium]|nr:hypothetical protein [Candidatus Obscuribacterales bacterium]
MGTVIYALCAIASIVCFGLLFRSAVASKQRLIFWTAFCFFLLSIQNIILFIDLTVISQTDLSIWRTSAGFVGCSGLLFALLWESR